HGVSAVGENADADRTDATDGPAHRNPSIWRTKPMLFERHHSQHRGVSGRTDRHRLATSHRFRQRNEPVAFDARLLGIGAQTRLPATPAIENDLVARLPGCVV